MTGPDPSDVFGEMVNDFVENLSAHVFARLEAWRHGEESRQVQEVLGGILARQATLATELAINPYILNIHTAPLLLRPMVESCINVAWILQSSEERCKMFVSYGLGQENLLLEQSKADLREAGEDPDENPGIKQWEQWINSQRFTFLTEVNVGSWSGSSLREMAEEVGLMGIYRVDYAMWSGATHNTWNHISHANLRPCVNPLHGYHRVPEISRPGYASIHLLKAAEYVDLITELLDHALGTDVDVAKAADVLNLGMDRLSELEAEWENELRDENNGEGESSTFAGGLPHIRE